MPRLCGEGVGSCRAVRVERASHLPEEKQIGCARGRGGWLAQQAIALVCRFGATASDLAAATSSLLGPAHPCLQARHDGALG